MTTPRCLEFGLFPGMTGAETPVRLPWDPLRTAAGLDGLQPAGKTLWLRAYLHYLGRGQAGPHTPADMTSYLGAGRKLELVLCYRTPDGDLDDWRAFIRTILGRWGRDLSALQVAEEPNSVAADGDGGFPHVREAIVAGVLAAKEESLRLGYDIAVGCNSTPTVNPADDFWPSLGTLGGDAFRQALDYVGLDFFPDVFRRFPPTALAGAVEFVLTGMRTQHYVAAGIPLATPMVIGETSWPTGTGRTPDRQAEVLEEVVRVIDRLKGTLNISRYTWFALRDPDSSLDDTLTQFGLMRDDYTPKPAYGVFRRLVEELGS